MKQWKGKIILHPNRGKITRAVLSVKPNLSIGETETCFCRREFCQNEQLKI
jgi:hypothetical protein